MRYVLAVMIFLSVGLFALPSLAASADKQSGKYKYIVSCELSRGDDEMADDELLAKAMVSPGSTVTIQYKNLYLYVYTQPDLKNNNVSISVSTQGAVVSGFNDLMYYFANKDLGQLTLHCEEQK